MIYGTEGLMEKISIADVAKHAGVSKATITRVVNRTGYVAAKTLERVVKSIEELGYIPNRVAGALKNNKTGVIGSILPLAPDNPFFTAISMSLKQAALDYGCHILTMYHERAPKRVEKLLREALSRMVEGIIFTGGIQSGSRAIRELLEKRLPVIMIERPLNISGADKVLLDYVSGSAAAGEAFISRGHRLIGFIGKECQAGLVEQERFNGFRQTLEGRGIPVTEPRLVFTQDYSAEYGYRAMKQLIEKSGKARPTACLIASDTLVCGALQYLYDARLRVPEDLSIIGY
ncbi:MAG: LacI family transcriptional regulator, partial [Treponema sp.]|nr:LacI family transcriptional regulator [Treponema sp.]